MTSLATVLPTPTPQQQVFPPEILDVIVSNLPHTGDDKNAIRQALRACALASRAVSRPARSILFRKVIITFHESPGRVAKLLDILADSWLCYCIKELTAAQHPGGSWTSISAGNDEELVAACLKRVLECGGLVSLTLGRLSWRTLSPILRHEVALTFGATLQEKVRNGITHEVDQGHTIGCLTLENVLEVPTAFLFSLPALRELTLSGTTFSCKSGEDAEIYYTVAPNLRSLTYDKGVLTNFYNDVDATLFSRLERLQLLELGKGVDMHTADMFLSSTAGSLTALSLSVLLEFPPSKLINLRVDSSTRHLKSDIRHWKELQTSGALNILTSLELSFPGPHHVEAFDDVKTMLKQGGLRSITMKSFSLSIHIATCLTEAEFVVDHPTWRGADRAIANSFPQLEDCTISCSVEVVPEDWCADGSSNAQGPLSTQEAMKKVHTRFARAFPSTRNIGTRQTAFDKVLGLSSLQAFTWRHRISMATGRQCLMELSRRYSS